MLMEQLEGAWQLLAAGAASSSTESTPEEEGQGQGQGASSGCRSTLPPRPRLMASDLVSPQAGSSAAALLQQLGANDSGLGWIDERCNNGDSALPPR